MSSPNSAEPKQLAGDAAHHSELLQQQISELRQRLEQLEDEVSAEIDTSWQKQYYTGYYATTGFLLGFFGAVVSLMCNILGSLIWPQVTGQPEQHPLRLIQVFLTFPLGEPALSVESGLTLAIGCCLYIGTGMLYGMVFQLVLTKWFYDASLLRRLLITTVLSLLIWLVNFNVVLSWLQPALFGGRWIYELVPAWVAALTHLAFGWTMAVLYPLGLFTPYHVETEAK